MFTGIIEEIGTVNRLQRKGNGYELTVRSKKVVEDAQPGDSIAINGTCLTVIRIEGGGFSVGLSPETRSRTNLVNLREGDPVNLERSLSPASRLGGHFVQGHVDGVGTITAFRTEEDSLWVTMAASENLMRYIVPKGFIALDGVSLTVVDVDGTHFTVTLVAYTQQHITLPRQPIGYKINIEVDILSKYVDKLLEARFGQQRRSTVDLESLVEHGYR